MAKLKKKYEKLFIDIIIEIKSKKYEIDQELDKIINKFEKNIEVKSNKYLKKTYPINFIGNNYKGETKDSNLPHGIGTIVYQNEDIFSGEFLDTLRHGIGKYVYFGSHDPKYHPTKIAYYVGEWFADSNDGLGESLINQWEDLTIYRGNWTENRINGFGYYHTLGYKNEKIPKKELIGYFVNDQCFKYIIEINRKENGQLQDHPPSGLYEFNVEQGTKTPMYEFKSIKEWDDIKISKNKRYPILEKIIEPYLDNKTKSKEFRNSKLDFSTLLTKLQIKTSDYGMDSPDILLEWFSRLNELNRDSFSFSNLTDIKQGIKKIKNLEEEFKKLKKKLNL